MGTTDPNSQGYGESIPGSGRLKNPQDLQGFGKSHYVRPEARIREDIWESLSEHNYLETADIKVDVQGPVVILRGSVPDRWMKFDAEELVQSIPGVEEVRNDLHVERRKYTDLRASLPNDR